MARSASEQLAGNYDVVCLGREELNLLDTKKVFQYIRNNQFDAVIHTATYDAAPEFSTNDPKLVLENNLKMFFNVARCKDYFGKMIYLGSGAEFGRENWVPKMSEEYYDKHVPTDQYGLSKYIMMQHTLVSKNIFNLRLFGLFGKYDDWRYRFIPNACCKVVLGLPLVIKQNARFDYLYIDDLVKIIEWFITNEPKHKDYNICSGLVYDYVTLANKILDIGSKNLDIIIKKGGLRDEYSGNNARIVGEMKDFSFTDVDEAIEEVYCWYNENKRLIKKELFVY